MINTIIFSKDRACQLDLLIRSIKKYFHLDTYKLIVLYTTSNDKYEIGYDILKNLHKDVSFIKENNFKNDFISLIDKKLPYIITFTDDAIIRDHIVVDNIFYDFVDNEDIMCINMRLGRSVEYRLMDDLYGGPELIRPPELDSGNIWRWVGDHKTTGFYYPMSAFGHLFRTVEFVEYISIISWNGIHDYETMMANNPMKNPLLICYDTNKIIDICLNVVLEGSDNLCGNISTEKLNTIWLSGKRIKDDIMFNLPTNVEKMAVINFDFERR